MLRRDPLRIGIDSRNLLLSEGTGVATYGRTLLESLVRMGSEAELILDTGRAPFDRSASESPHSARLRRYLQAIRLRLSTETMRAADFDAMPEQDLLRRFARVRAAHDVFRVANIHLDIYRRPVSLTGEDPPPLMHWTYPLPIRLRGALNIYTVHDLIPLREPALTSIDQRKFRRLIGPVMACADHIVTVSESSRRDIIELLGCTPENVTNTYQALELPPSALTNADARVEADIAAALGLPRGGYLLYAGSIEPRKNVRALIDAHRVSGTALPLVLAGPDGWRAREELAPLGEQIVAAPSRGGVFGEGAVVRLPYVAYETLLSVIRGARALVFPSLSEGFGLPILEAMALGTPVITSNFGAMAEIAGTAAMLVDPRNRRDLAQAIQRVSTDPMLCADLTERGRCRAAAFSLDSYTERLERLYRGLIDGAGSTAR